MKSSQIALIVVIFITSSKNVEPLSLFGRISAGINSVTTGISDMAINLVGRAFPGTLLQQFLNSSKSQSIWKTF